MNLNLTFSVVGEISHPCTICKNFPLVNKSTMYCLTASILLDTTGSQLHGICDKFIRMKFIKLGYI